MPLKCGHQYHGKCIVPWLQTKGTCPLCRDGALLSRRDAPRPRPRTTGYLAFCAIKKRVVKDELEAEIPADVTIRAQAVIVELARRWSALPDMEKTQWRELAIEAAGDRRALRRLLVEEPQMMPGNE